MTTEGISSESIDPEIMNPTVSPRWYDPDRVLRVLSQPNIFGTPHHLQQRSYFTTQKMSNE